MPSGFTLTERIEIQSTQSGDGLRFLVDAKGWDSSKSDKAFKSRFGDELIPAVSIDLSHTIYGQYLSNLKNLKLGEPVVAQIDQDIQSVFSRLNARDPNSLGITENSRPGYGLVVGRVQSGKTANMLGLGILSMDEKRNKSGKVFDTVIILSGLIDDLRKQTFERLKETKIQEIRFTPSGKDLTQNKESIKAITDHFSSQGASSKMIIVIKKNHLILEKLTEIIKSVPSGLHAKRRVMIIDDECDHASIDSSNSESNYSKTEEKIITATNQNLRRLIASTKFMKSTTWYIGYTATPYSNILMEPDPNLREQDLGYTLYPRDFIIALGKPQNHLDNYNYFVNPNDNVFPRISPAANSKSEEDGMRDLIYLHIGTFIIKKYFREIDSHHTTLIHTDVNTDEHIRFARLLNNLLESIKQMKGEDLTQALSSNLVKYRILTVETKVGFKRKVEQLQKNGSQMVQRLLERIKIVELNRRSSIEYEQDEDYDFPQELIYEGRNKSIIVVGGTRLARGLTLKGLTTSWFTRTSTVPKYDTMLQMARWCGYRPGYADLVRILIDSDSEKLFKLISKVEDDLRTDLLKLTDASDPLKEIIWIRKYEKMEISGRLPKDLRKKRIGGDLPPQIWTLHPSIFYCKSPTLTNKRNWDSFVKLESKVSSIQSLTKPPKGESNYKVFKNIKGKTTAAPTYNHLKKLRKKLSESKYPMWNVAIHRPIKNTTASFDNRKLVDRTNIFEKEIQIVHSGTDAFSIDLEQDEERKIPLLIFYISNQNYSPNGKRVYPSGLSMPIPLFGVLFSSSNHSKGELKVARPLNRGDV